jgi:hypothetical protein
MKIIKILIMVFSVAVNAKPKEDHLETVMAYQVGQGGIEFRVYDGGCTAPEDFELRVERKEYSTAFVSLYRKRFDFCKAFFPMGHLIRYGYDEIGLKRNEPFIIVNPINPGFIED